MPCMDFNIEGYYVQLFASLPKIIPNISANIEQVYPFFQSIACIDFPYVRVTPIIPLFFYSIQTINQVEDPSSHGTFITYPCACLMISSFCRSL